MCGKKKAFRNLSNFLENENVNCRGERYLSVAIHDKSTNPYTM